MSAFQKFYAKALIGAVILNILFFILLGWAWFHSVYHKKHVPNQVTPSIPIKAMQTVKTSIVPTAATSQSKQLAQYIANTFNHKVTIAKTFKGPGKLQGLVLKMNGSDTSNFIAYYNASAKQLYLGSVINGKGINTTIAASQKYLSDPLKPIIYNKVQTLKAVLTGPKQFKHQLTIIIDPNAPLFKPLYQNLLEENKDFALQVRWVLVNYLKPMGPNLAGWIYAGNHPAKRLATIASTPAKQWTTKNYPPLSQTIIKQLRTNWNVMQDNHLVPGPVTIFKVSSEYYVLKGLVDFESLEQVLPNMSA